VNRSFFLTFCCLTYALQRLGHASPHLRAVRALPDRVPLGPRPLLLPSPPPHHCRPLFDGFIARMAGSDFLGSCITGYGSSPSRHGPAVLRRPSPRSPGSRARSVPHMPGSPTAPSPPNTRVGVPVMLPSTLLKPCRPSGQLISRLHGWPVRSPVNASPAASRIRAHDSGPLWFATPSVQWTYTIYSSPVLPAHSTVPHQCSISGPIRAATPVFPPAPGPSTCTCMHFPSRAIEPFV